MCVMLIITDKDGDQRGVQPTMCAFWKLDHRFTGMGMGQISKLLPKPYTKRCLKRKY